MKFFLRELNFLFRFAFVFLLAAVVLALVMAVVSQKFKALGYRSSAVVEFLPIESLGEVPNERFFRTECEKIVSARVLEKVSDFQDLERKWGLKRGEVVAQLKNAVTCQPVKGTSLGRVEVTHFDPEMAEALAGEIPRAYQRWRGESIRNAMEMEIERLDASIDEQKDRVEAKRKVLDTIVRITGRPYFEDRSLTREVQSRFIAGLEEAELVNMSTELHDYVESTKAYERSIAELEELRGEYFKRKTEFDLSYLDWFNSINVLEESSRPMKAGLTISGLRSTFWKMFSKTSALAAIGLVLVLFARAFWWGRHLKEPSSAGG